MNNQKILILGVSGMLGSIVYKYLKSKYKNVTGTVRKKFKKNNLLEFDAQNFLINRKKYNFIKNYDYIINCIGIIKPYCKDDDEKGITTAIEVNALFPHKLAQYLINTNVKVIQIATDCVYSGKDGSYSEKSLHDALDVYGKTKSLGEVYGNKNFLNIRCSIIGPEQKAYLSLLEWFLHQPDKSELNGFTHHKWNGVTTLQFAKLCESIINSKNFDKLTSLSSIHHFVPNNTVNKYQLLNIFTRHFKKNYKINKVGNIGPAVDRSIISEHSMLNDIFGNSSMNKAIAELAKYMGKYE